MSTEAEKQAFKEKLKSISFGIVPGGYRDTSSTSMFDRDAVMEQLGHSDKHGSAFSKERIKDAESKVARAHKEFEDAQK